MTWTTPADVKSRWLGTTPPPVDTQLQVFIDDVEGQVLNRYRGLQERIDAGEPTLDFVKSSIARIVIEFLQTKGNPFSQVSHSYSGAISESVSYSSQSSRYSLSLTEADYALFGPNTDGKAFSLNLGNKARTSGFCGDPGACGCGRCWTIIV